MLWVAMFATLWVFVQATVEQDARQQREPATAFDISGMLPGNVKTELWANRPLVIVHLLPEWESVLPALSLDLYKDPSSDSSVQPDEAVNAHRSPVPGWFVGVGLGTAMGCPLRFAAPSTDRYLGMTWPGGFIDTCDSSRYDLAGRVFRQQSAKKNIVVPQWRLVDGKIIVGG